MYKTKFLVTIRLYVSGELAAGNEVAVRDMLEREAIEAFRHPAQYAEPEITVLEVVNGESETVGNESK